MRNEWLILALGSLAACRQDMHDQPRYEPLEASAFFADGRSARPAVEGTIARGRLEQDEHFTAGKVNGEIVSTLPFPLTRELLERGRERYDIFCAPCHARTGSGEGVVVQRGMTRPASLHIARLREAKIGYFFDVMTNGFGAMYDFRDRISAADRWAIAAYMRALQLSQNASLQDVPGGEREALFSEPQ